MKKIISIALMFSGVFFLANADCYLVYSSKVTSSLGGPGRHGPMSDSKCSNLKAQQAGVVGSSNVWCECSSGGTSTGGYSGKDAWKYQMMQELMKSFMDGMVQGMEKKEQRLKEQRMEEQRAKEKEDERKKQAELKRIKDEREKNIAREEWEKIKLKEAQIAIEEAQKKRVEANLLLEQIGSSSGTSFFESSNAATQGIAFKPMGTAKYDASRLKSLSRAMCSTYFSNQALLAGNDLEKARYYNSQADKVTAGEMYEEECKIPVIPEPPEPKQVLSSEDAAFLKEMETMTLDIQQGIKQFQLINTKLQNNKLKIQEAQEKKEKAEQTINKIQTKATTMTPEELALVAEANTLLSEAKNDLKTANQINDKLIDEQNQIQKSIQEKYRSLQEQPSPLRSTGGINEKR